MKAKAIFQPPEQLRVGPLREDAFKSPLRSTRLAALLGVMLGVTFSVCFATGLISHVIQHPVSWVSWPSRPAGLYRVTQGVHVATGLASIPLLLAKLWVVYPHFWTWPPIKDIAHAVERISLVPLVGGSLFMLFTGLANTGLWYPWNFFFPTGHFWGAWITIGALVVHIGAKLALTRAALFGSRDEAQPSAKGLSRRSFLGVVAGTTGLVTLTTIGQTVGPLKSLGLLAPRDPSAGPQGFPVNQSAAEAVITAATWARTTGWR